MIAAVLALAGGCGSPVDPFGPAIDLSLMIMTPSAAPSTLHASVGDRRVSLSVSDAPASRVDKRVRGTGYGDMPVHLVLLGSSGDTLASTSFTQKLQPSYRYGIGVIVGPQRLLGFCSATIRAVPLRNSASDSLFVDVSGLPDGAVC